jgi:hypothetical protein
MNPESKLWNKVKQALPKEGFAQRIENTLERGTPDLHYFLNGSDYWIELKASNGLLVRKEQVVWHLKRNVCGGKSYIIFHHTKDDLYYCFVSPFEFEKHDDTYQHLVLCGLEFEGATVSEVINQMLGLEQRIICPESI